MPLANASGAVGLPASGTSRRRASLSNCHRDSGKNNAESPSLTSREILRRPDLPAGSGTDLATLVQAVEISRFGGRPAVEAIFQSCRESYRRLVSAGPAAVPS